ncbi:MAG TPA: M20/M25/M40 family metallo-hydrolase [Opitutaceae bacterium]|nr:M20/M25/M40 family metallo-hydrolase [Opitutaceae bacterium]
MFDPIEVLKNFVRHQSVSTDPAFHAGMRGAQEHISETIRGLGFEVEVVRTPKHPVIYAHRGGDASWPHVIIYGHYDVQPADPLEKWTTPPFEPTIRDGRMYGRGTADNKGPLLAHVTAVGRLLEAEPTFPLRISFVIEGEEEMGSPSFRGFLEQYRDRLKADFVMLSDTGVPAPDQMVITCGLRGLMLLELEVTGAQMDLHSGLHGGVLRNPIQAIAELCASLHDADGRVTVPGFYDDVREVAQWECDELAKLGTDTAEYQRFLGIKGFHVAGGFTPFEAIRFQPTLEFNGIGGGYQGAGSKTVIPSRAFVKISCRLVPDQEPARIRELVYKAIRERMPADVNYKIHDGHSGTPYVVVPPGRSNTPSDQSPVLARAFEAAETVVTDVFGKRPLYIREGGSVPIVAELKSMLGLDCVLLGLFLPEDNLHAPNESFDLSMLEKGARVSEGVLRAVAAVRRR